MRCSLYEQGLKPDSQIWGSGNITVLLTWLLALLRDFQILGRFMMDWCVQAAFSPPSLILLFVEANQWSLCPCQLLESLGWQRRQD